MIALIENGPEDTESLTKAMEAIPKTSVDRIGDFDDYVFEDSKEDERALEDLRERMGKLVVKARAKVTKERIYSAAYHPEVTKDLIFFGGKCIPLAMHKAILNFEIDRCGTLGIWDARAPSDEDEDGNGEAEGGKYWRIQLHWPANPKSSISNIKLDPINAHNVSLRSPTYINTHSSTAL